MIYITNCHFIIISNDNCCNSIIITEVQGRIHKLSVGMMTVFDFSRVRGRAPGGGLQAKSSER